MHRSPRARFAAASLAVMALALAACGDDDDDTSGTETTSVEDTTDDTTEDTTDETSETSDTTDETTEVTGDTSDTSDTTPGSGTGGGEVGTQDEYVEATATAVGYEDEAFNQCIAEAVVSDEVYAAIEESGRTVEEFQSGGPADLGLEEEQVMAVADEMAACGDLIPQVVQNEDERACVEASIDNNQMAQVLALSTFGLELTEELNAASDEVDACVEGLSATTTT